MIPLAAYHYVRLSLQARAHNMLNLTVPNFQILSWWLALPHSASSLVERPAGLSISTVLEMEPIILKGSEKALAEEMILALDKLSATGHFSQSSCAF